jgi:lipocalin
MIASAASALRRGVAMKKCAYAHCGDWFELRRTDAFYCSGSCQAADYKQRAMAQGATVLEIASHKRKGRSHGKRT